MRRQFFVKITYINKIPKRTIKKKVFDECVKLSDMHIYLH